MLCGTVLTVFFVFSFHEGLNYEGVQRLLGLTKTKGTIEYALPLPRSSLFLSFASPYEPIVSQ